MNKISQRILPLSYLHPAATLILSLYALFFFFKFIHYHYLCITFPYALEFREGVMPLTTDILLKGGNPYSFAYQPMAMNLYGILYHLIIFPFAKIFGATNFLHRLVTAIFIFASCFNIFWVLRIKKVSIALSLAASLALYSLLLFPATSTSIAGPHSLGLFLFLSSLSIPFFLQFSTFSLITSLTLSVLAFFTKPYFILGAVYLASYLFLFISKRKALLYGLAFAILLSFSMAIVYKLCNAYFNNTVMANINIADYNIPHLNRQLGMFIKCHREILILFLLLGIIAIIQNKRTLSNFANPFSNFKTKINVTRWDKPLLAATADLFLYSFIFSTVIIVLNLGRHGGSWMAYLFQLMSPFLLIIIFDRIQKSLLKFPLLVLPTLIAVVMNFYNIHAYFPKKLNVSYENWQIIEKLVATHKNILNSPVITSLLVQKNKPVYDSGNSEYFKHGSYRYGVFKKILPADARALLKHYAYMETLATMVKNQEFDLLIVTKGYAPLVPGIIKEYYDYVGYLQIVMPNFQQNWILMVFKPKPATP